MLGFWYVTDDAVTGSGAALRNIHLEAANYREDPGLSDDGWTVEGWARTGPVLPQLWSVQVIELGGAARAQRLPLDSSGRLVMPITGDADRTILAVSGLTPVTLERASFHLEIRLETRSEARRQ